MSHRPDPSAPLPAYWKPQTHFGGARNPDWDYQGRATYMITMVCAAERPPLSTLTRTPKGHWVRPTKLGAAVRQCLEDMPAHCPGMELYRYIIMPDHIHFLLHIKERIPHHVGFYIGQFASAATKALAAHTPALAGASLFNDDKYNDQILRTPDRFARARQYILDNPRRLFIKQQHADLFSHLYHIDVTYDLLDHGGEAQTRLNLVGNAFLLDAVEIERVQVSRSASDEFIAELCRQWELKARRNVVAVSPFLSPGEKKILETVIAAGGRVILLETNAIGDRYKPGGRYFDLCASGRLLVMATADAPRWGAVTRRQALTLNSIAWSIAAGRCTRIK